MLGEVGSATVKLLVTLDEPVRGNVCELAPSAFCYERRGEEGEIVAVKVVVRVRRGEGVVRKAEFSERGTVLAKYGLRVLASVTEELGLSLS